MKLSSGKRIGQSRQELATAVTFSFFLHIIFFLAAVFLYFTVKPRIYVPPFYEVKLVGQPADQTVLPQTPPVAPKQEVKEAPKPKGKKAAPKEHKASKKGVLPELAVPKQKPSRTEEGKPSEKREQPQTSANTAVDETAAPPGLKPESVAVATPQQDFKFGWYLVRVRDKIGQNWSPPPDATDARARVIFSINRSGWVGDVNLVADQSSGTFTFKQAAVRAIRASNPFPPLPEEFSKQTLEFTVDLTAVE